MPLDLVNYVKVVNNLKTRWDQGMRVTPFPAETTLWELEISGFPVLKSPRPLSAIPNLGNRGDMFRTFICDTCKRLKHDLHSETMFYQDDNPSFYRLVVEPLNAQIVKIYIELCTMEGYQASEEMIEEIERYDASDNLTRVENVELSPVHNPRKGSESRSRYRSETLAHSVGRARMYEMMED